METKFDKLVEQILQEGIGDPASEADAVRAGNAARDQRLADLGARSSYSSGPRRRYDDETPAAPHYEVFLSPEGKARYERDLKYVLKKNPGDAAKINAQIQKMEQVQYSFKSFPAKFPEKARKFAAKYGTKDKYGYPEYKLISR